MKRALLLMLISAAALPASVLLSFDPPGANLVGHAGDTVTWNFELQNNANWLLIDAVDYQTLTPVGTYNDLFTPVAPEIGPTDTVPGQGSYAIDPPAPPFLSTGFLIVTYDEFSQDPATDPDPSSHQIGFGETVSAAASVQVVGPEPSTLLLLAPVGLWMLVRRRRLG